MTTALQRLVIADAWRMSTQHHDGVVIVCGSAVAGWMDTLRNPEHWEPGCIAIDADGTEHLATGGNRYDGAASWVAHA